MVVLELISDKGEPLIEAKYFVKFDVKGAEFAIATEILTAVTRKAATYRSVPAKT